jgi:hypothetical protein
VVQRRILPLFGLLSRQGGFAQALQRVSAVMADQVRGIAALAACNLLKPQVVLRILPQTEALLVIHVGLFKGF